MKFKGFLILGSPYIYVGSAILFYFIFFFLGGGGVKNFEFQYFGGLTENEYFWGIKILWIFFGVITKLDWS